VVLRLASSETNLLDERKTSELRKEFVAVLGDEVRHPLTAIISAADMLKLTPLRDRRSRSIASHPHVRTLHRSCAIFTGRGSNSSPSGRFGGGS
jgi:signal transduction histidine kinase